MKLDGKVAVVTGGATGMGRAICELFGREGARVIVNYRASRDEAEQVAETIRSGGSEAIALEADVSDDRQARSVMRDAAERWGGIDVLVNNAAWSKRVPHGNLDDLTDEIWDRTLNTNLRGAFYCMRAAAPFLRGRPGAAVVNIASIAPYAGDGSTIVYAASKAGLISMTKSFARVFAPDVRVNAIAPGLVETRFAGWPAETFVKGAADSPLKRITTVEEIAAAVLFLAADATAMTGETITIDCGVTSLRHT